MIDQEKQTRLGAEIQLVDQHGAREERWLFLLQRDVDQCRHQWMTGMDQIRRRLAEWRAREVPIEGDALVLLKHRPSTTVRAVMLANRGRHMTNLVAILLTLFQRSAVALDGFHQEAPQVERLKLARLGDLHRLLHIGESLGREDILGQCVATVEVLDVLPIERAIHNLKELRLHLRIFPVADGFDEQILERLVFKGLAQDVEDAAAEGFALHLKLVEEALKDFTLTRVARDQIPEPTDLHLADAVNAPKALLDAVRVPGQVVVHHQVGHLKVHAFACGIRRDEDHDVRVLAKLLLCSEPVLAPRPAVDLDHRHTAEQVAHLLHEVVERVAMLGEDEHLPTSTVLPKHDRVVALQDGGELIPLGIDLRGEHIRGLPLEPFENFEFLLQLDDRLGRSGVIHELRFDEFEFLRRELFVCVFGIKVEVALPRCLSRLGWIAQLNHTLGEACTSSPEGLRDCSG